MQYRVKQLSVHYFTFNTSPTKINLLHAEGEYLTKSPEKHTNYSIIFII